MRIESRYLTANVRIIGLRVSRRRLVVQGLVKEFMPMTVEVGAADLVQTARVLASALRRRLGRIRRPEVVAAPPPPRPAEPVAAPAVDLVAAVRQGARSPKPSSGRDAERMAALLRARRGE